MPSPRRGARVAVSTRYVVDATVAQAAGSSEARVSRRCREFLMDMYIICHRVVVTKEIVREWDVHRSKFFVMWLSWMKKKNKLADCGDCTLPSLRRALEGLDCEDVERETMLDDLHLVEAALAADRRIVSLDRHARTLFEGVAGGVEGPDRVEWLDPLLGDRPPGRR
jgi:hypothetical protein